MAVGTRTYEGLAVPVFGESEIVQQTAATDILTLTGADTQTGDFLVLRSSAGTERYAVTAEGYHQLRVFTTVPTTGLTKGDFMLLFHGSMPKLAVCTSTAANTVKMIRLSTKTLGRQTA